MNAQQVVRLIRTFMEQNSYSQSRLAREAKVPQSTISRALGSPVRLSRTHHALCNFAGIDIQASQGRAGARESLVQAVLDVWDGTDEHAQSIARLLKVAATLEAYGAARAGKPPRTHAHR